MSSAVLTSRRGEVGQISPYHQRTRALAGSDGTFSIAQVPEGTYTIVAWHERLKPQRQVIRVQPGESVSIDFVL